MAYRLVTGSLVVLASLVLGAHPAAAERDMRSERVQFAPGATSATVEASIRGYETVDYVLRLGAGQYLNVSMATDNSASYFNILAPGEDTVAFFNGSIASGGNQYEGTTGAAGDYRIRVYMMRSAARRGEVANYRLEMIATGPAAGAADALVPGTDYHATGQVRCSMGSGGPGWCDFGVIREGNGSGTVIVTRPDGQSRAIFFQEGKASGYDMSQANDGEFSAGREDDTTIVRIGGERYEIPDAVIFGG